MPFFLAFSQTASISSQVLGYSASRESRAFCEYQLPYTV